MKITMYYEDKNHPTILEVPDEECTVMVETDYQRRLAVAADEDSVQRRTVQEIMDEEINKPTFNNNHAETRRHVSLAAFDPEDKSFTGVSDIETDLFDEDYAELYQAIRKLKPQQKELLSKVFWKGMKQVEIAREMGLAKNTVSERMARIYLTLKKNLSKNLSDRKIFF